MVLRSLLGDGWVVRWCLPFARLPGKLCSHLLLLFRLDLSLFDDRADKDTHTHGASAVQSIVSVRAAVPIVEHVITSLDIVPIVPDCGRLSRVS